MGAFRLPDRRKPPSCRSSPGQLDPGEMPFRRFDLFRPRHLSMRSDRSSLEGHHAAFLPVLSSNPFSDDDHPILSLHSGPVRTAPREVCNPG